MEPTSHAGPLEVYRSVVWPVYEYRRTAQRSVDDGLDRHGPTPAVSSHNRRNPRFVAKSPTHRSDETSASSLLSVPGPDTKRKTNHLRYPR